MFRMHIWLLAVWISNAATMSHVQQGMAVESVLRAAFTGPDPVMVMHKKQPGKGNDMPGSYKEGSPLFEREQRHLETVKRQAKIKDNPFEMESTTEMPEHPWVGDHFTTSCLDPLPPVSTTMQNVVVLAMVYFLVYTALAIARSVYHATGKEGLMRVMQGAATVVDVAPMLCVLYLAARVRAVQLGQGNPEKYSLPPIWMEAAMWIATCLLILQLVLVFAASAVSGRVASKESVLDATQYYPYGSMAYVMLTVLRFMAVFGVFLAAICVASGTVAMNPPASIWNGSEVPLSAAVECIISLVFQYFIVNTLHQITVVYSDVYNRGVQPEVETWRPKLALEAAAHVFKIAPMFCVLFLASRLRALQVHLKHGTPQTWAQVLFYVATYTLTAQAVCALGVPLLAQGRVAKGDVDGDVRFDFGKSTAKVIAVRALQIVFLVFIYFCAVAIVFSIIFLRDEKTDKAAPVPSPTMTCILTLVCLYFAVYFAAMVAITVRTFRGEAHDQRLADRYRPGSAPDGLTVVLSTLQSALLTLVFAPMLCVLMLAVRIRALQITKGQGHSPKYAQAAMGVAVVVVCLQLCMVFLVPFVTGGVPPRRLDDMRPGDPAITYEDGSVELKSPDKKAANSAFEVVRYVLLLFLYGSILTLVASIFIMDCNTTTGIAPVGTQSFMTTPGPFEPTLAPVKSVDWGFS
mmetsp:Transcript_18362/g.40580  ORF Transcript_18362/g.40580 Transcript_18362/m.40580 type:complete len:689 (+) Transcript_18362:171-2237(+)